MILEIATVVCRKRKGRNEKMMIDVDDQGTPRYLMVVKNTRFLYSHFLPIAEAVQQAGWEVWIAAEKTTVLSASWILD